MPNYRRVFVPGGCYFFTVNLLERKRTLLTDHIDLLRESVRTVRRLYPFHIDAWVVLPDHMHCVLTLPPDTDDYPLRWRLIKLLFSKGLPPNERLSARPYGGSIVRWICLGMTVWRVNRTPVRWISRTVDLPWQSTNKRSLVAVMCLQMLPACLKWRFAARNHPTHSHTDLMTRRFYAELSAGFCAGRVLFFHGQFAGT